MTVSSNRPFIVEVLGVAGSGKSTITSRLLAGPELRPAPFISARRWHHLTQMLLALPRLTPVVLSGLLRKPRMTWADFKLMAFVTRWGRLLESARYAKTTLVYDQGPIYALVRLEAKDLGLVQTRSFGAWQNERLLDWIPRLNMIIWVDAPDDLLLARINERDQSHWVKGEAVEVSQAFVQRYRDLFLAVLGDIEAIGGPEIHRFDTSKATADEIAQEVSRVVTRRADR